MAGWRRADCPEAVMTGIAIVLIPAIVLAQAPEPLGPPDPAEQIRIVASLRKSAMRYEGHLPDFICTKITTRSIDATGTGDRLKQQDVLEERVAFSGGRTVYTLTGIDGKPTKKTHA